MTRYKIHHLAELFPEMTPMEFQALKADIAENGQREPIWLYENKILDGRNRYRACVELRIQPKVKHLKMTKQEAVAFSISRNLQRRHLGKSQQAMYLVMADILPKSQTSETKRAYRTGDSAIRSFSKRYGISHVSLYKAIYVHENDSELAKMVRDGKLSVAKAEMIIRNRKESDRPRSPEKMQAWLRMGKPIQQVRRQLKELERKLVLTQDLGGPRVKRVCEAISDLMMDLEEVQPYETCSACTGNGCDRCDNRGWISLAEHNSETEDKRTRRPLPTRN